MKKTLLAIGLCALTLASTSAASYEQKTETFIIETYKACFDYAKTINGTGNSYVGEQLIQNKDVYQ